MGDYRFNLANLRRDLLASVVVFLVALPLCMGIALASGVPPEHAAAAGILTGIIGGVVVGLIGGAPLQVSGPAAGLAVLVSNVINDEQIGWGRLGLVVALAGAIQLLAGLAKLGQWFRAVSPAVIYGMLAGIGVLILASQFHLMIDDHEVTRNKTGLENLMSIPEGVDKALVHDEGFEKNHYLAARVGIVTIAILALWSSLAPRRLKVLPAALVAVGAATLLANAFSYDIAMVQLPASFVGEIAPLSLSELASVPSWRAILSAAVSIAFIASAETLLSVTAVDKMHGGPRARYDRELAAQGVGNALSGFLGGLPMTGVIVRSAANVDAGARTRASAVMHGLWLLLLVELLPHALKLIPTSSLGALLVYTGYKLVNPKAIRELWRVSKTEFAIYLVTVSVIVSVDLLAGVVTGVLLSAAKLLYTFSNLRIEVRDDPAGRRTEMRLHGTATFIRLPQLAEALDAVPGDRELHVRLDDLSYIDHACLDLIVQWEVRHKTTGGSLSIDWEGLHARFRSPSAVAPGRGKEPAQASG